MTTPPPPGAPDTGSAEISVVHVDDEPRLAELVGEFLERQDGALTVATYTDPKEALERVSTDERVDCVVSDYDMPEQNGIELLEAIRSVRPDVPFILYTGKGSEDVATEALAAGATDYLQKESGTSQYTVLSNRIRNAVDQHRARRALVANERRFSTFFEESPLGAIEWDDSKTIRHANAEAQAILGYVRSDLIGRSVDTLVPTDPGNTAASAATPTDIPDGEFERISVQTGAGDQRICEWHNRVVTDDEGIVVTRFSKFRDVTDEHRRRERQQRQQDALVSLTKDPAITSGDFEAAAELITETAADVIDVHRVNLWLFEDGGATLRCVDHFDRSTGTHDAGAPLAADNYPEYFEALEENRSLAADDVTTDPRTAELLDDYLEPNGITSLLDATLRSEGEVIGVLCHEHVGEPRVWEDDERQFAGEMADIVYRALRNQRQQEQRRTIERHESMLQAQQKAVIDGTLIFDDTGDIISYNERLVDLLDIPRDVLATGSGKAVLDWALDELESPADFEERTQYLFERPSETAHGKVQLRDGRTIDYFTTPLSGQDSTHFGRLWRFRELPGDTD